jgi:2-C-methyl-D-erythritol 4-phosphate cytidylyltransferase
MQQISTSKFLDLGDEIIAVHQIKKFNKHKLTDEVDLTISRLEEPKKSEARAWKKQRQME